MEKQQQDKLDMSRCIENKFIIPEKEDDRKALIEKLTATLKNEVFNNTIKKVQPPYSDKSTNSSGKHRYDPMIYTGTGGNMYAYWRFYLLNKFLKSKGETNEYNKIDDLKTSSLQLFKTAVDTHYDIFVSEVKNNPSIFSTLPSSFYLGPPGIIVMKIIYLIEVKDTKNLKPLLEDLIKFKKSALSEKSEHEVLYGYGGYLWTLLFIHRKLQSIGYEYDLSAHISEVFYFIIKEGNKYQKTYNTKCLAYIFPSDTKVESLEDFYLGAAHGILGNLYVLVDAMSLFDGVLSKYNKDYSKCVKLVEESLDYILTLQYKSGNFPSSLGKDRDQKLHFCHGATGAVFVYIKAYNFFKKKEYLNAVIKAADDIWIRGIILKGNCICHGILGSSYALNAVYKLTSDSIWQLKSLAMACYAIDENVKEAVKKQPDKQRKIQGVPDSPFSLMEGVAGELTLYSDLVMKNAIFPGFEF